jgi:hypothetical protein
MNNFIIYQSISTSCYGFGNSEVTCLGIRKAHISTKSQIYLSSFTIQLH